MGDRGKSRSHKTRSCTQNQQSRKKKKMKNHCIRTAGTEKGQRFNRPCTTEAHGKAQSKRGQGRLYIHRRQLRQLAALCTTSAAPGTNSSLISRRAIVSRAACCAMYSPRDQRAERVPLHAFQAREYISAGETRVIPLLRITATFKAVHAKRKQFLARNSQRINDSDT